MKVRKIGSAACWLGILLILAGGPAARLASADTATVPSPYATIQDAVNAVQGTSDPLVVINSNSIFVETVTITSAVTIQAGSGYRPTIRGAPGNPRTIYIHPNSASAQDFHLKNLNLEPRVGISGCSGFNIIDILNSGAGEARIWLRSLTLDDPDNGGPDGVNIRSGYGLGGGYNTVYMDYSTITLGGDPGCGVDAFFMGETGSLTLKGVTVNMSLGDAAGFDLRGFQGAGIVFDLSDSTFNISAPSGHYSADIGNLLDTVNATLENNTFNLISNETGSAGGISAGPGSQDITLIANRFHGSGPMMRSAVRAAPRSGETTTIVAVNNVISQMIGFNLSPRSGTPGGIVDVTLTNNTMDGSAYSAVYFSLQDNSTLTGEVTNNLMTNHDQYGMEFYIGAGAVLSLTNDYNGFYNNTLGATDGTVTVGAHSLSVDPEYRNPGLNDFHLWGDSPCLDAGSAAASELPAEDFEGENRNNGAAPELGADEIGGLVFDVDSPADENDVTPGDGVCAAASGACTLRAAVQEANASAGADIIHLPAGTYTLGLAGAGEDAAATGDLDVLGDVTLTGDGLATTAIDGNDLDRVFEVHGAETYVKISGCTIRNGSIAGNGGGGIRNHRGTLRLDHTMVSGNAVTGTGSYDVGGGLFNQQGDLTVVDSHIDQNEADRGGGIFNAGSSIMRVERTTVSNNTSQGGGGLLLYGTSELTNVTVSGNTASNNGGGLSVSEEVTLLNCTVANNSGPLGNGLVNFGTVTLKNTILSNTTDNIYNAGAVISEGHNLADDSPGDLNDPTDILNTDPRLGPLQDNGGPAPTQALRPGSPAIDAGDDDGCPATDQRGVARPYGPACDIGAYEYDRKNNLSFIILLTED